MKTFLFALLMVFAITTSGHDQRSYYLLYHSGAVKKEVSVSIDNLIKAIRDGKQIKLYMKLGLVEH